MAHREEIVDDLESLVSGGIIDGGNVGYASEFGSGVVLQKRKGRYDARWWDVDGELVLPDRKSTRISMSVLQSFTFVEIGPPTAECTWVDKR